ncbi:MAG: rhodanese-like domain-containing protein [Rhodocyclaceae bacterium]|nr:MAG: rhodanese-like domain-containing protein [Rhodocyclaceae bacterium]
MRKFSPLLSMLLALSAPIAFAQEAAAPAAKTPYVAPPWTYKTKQLNKAQIDALLAKPGKVVVLDVRRPDELISKGSFPAFLNIQIKDLENNLDYIPKNRLIITVSNRAHRAGAAGDLLTTKGFKVAGAAGTLDYEDQGGIVAHITPPPPAPSK